jgi:putative nucleotidyltransferase with HDIG domain
MKLKDKETSRHARRAAHLAVRLAKEHGFSGLSLQQIYWGALLHDIGKLTIPDEIINKPGKLTEGEWRLVRQHPKVGGDLVQGFDFLVPAAEITYHHHERWDGSGYPAGLAGDQIPIAAQIFSIVDVWDSLLSCRPYRPAWVKDDVMEYLASESGRTFSGKVVDLFFSIVHA